MTSRFILSLVCSLCLMGTARAAVMANAEADKAPVGSVLGGPHNPTFPSGGPSSTDLINGLLPSASAGNFTLESSTGVAALTDGSVSTFYGDQTGASNHAAYATAGNAGGSGTSVDYALGGPHNLTEVVIYGGWNDGGRDQQHYDVLTSTDGVAFAALGTIDVNPGVFMTDTTPISSRVSFTETTLANLASGVTHIRVNFLAVENGYAGYTEVDVFGSRIPEPASVALAAASLAGVLAVRRRK